MRGFGIRDWESGDLRELPGTDVEQPTGLLAVLRGCGVLIGGGCPVGSFSARAAMRRRFVKVSLNLFYKRISFGTIFTSLKINALFMSCSPKSFIVNCIPYFLIGRLHHITSKKASPKNES